MRFGVSTHLYHDRPLAREHLVQIADHGFQCIELFATRSHFDYRDPAAVAALQGWLAQTGLTLQSVHAPITARFGSGDAWEPGFSTAYADAGRRQAAVQEADAALQLARAIPFETLVVHLGTPDSRSEPGDNNRTAAARSADEICRIAEPLGVRVALEVIPNPLSSPAALVALLERDLDSAAAGICLDFGHAFLGGDVVDAIETVAEHLIATHVHDNHGREDEHLVPYRGSIDWDSALIAMQKVGYDGVYLLELAGAGDPARILQEARQARERFERALAH
jgi:sugar phosphate isomerase/epimerase